MKRKCLTAAVLLLALSLALSAAALADDGYTLKNGGSSKGAAETVEVGCSYAAEYVIGTRWYRFRTPGGQGYITVSCRDNGSGSTYPMFYVLSGVDDELSWSFLSHETHSASLRLSPDTDYYIKIHNYDHTGYYRFSILFTPDAVGNDRDSAKAVVSGKEIKSTLDGQFDRDVFAFTPEESCRYILEGTNDTVGGTMWPMQWLLLTTDNICLGEGQVGRGGSFSKIVSLEAGTRYDIVIKNDGWYTGNYHFRIRRYADDISGFTLTLDSDTVPYTGKKAAPKVTVTDRAGRALKQGEDYTVTFSDNIRVGTASVTVRGKGEYSGTLKGAFQVKYDLSGAEITLTKDQYTYTGKALAPKVKSVTVAGKAVKAGTGYTVAYEDDRDAGTGKVILTGTGSCMGRAEKTFRITKAPLGTVVLSDEEIAYTGKAVAPEVTVKNKAGDKLTQGVDYTLTFKNNKAAGSAKVIVKGKGNYTGKTEAGFEIKYDLREASVTLSGYSFVFGGKKVRPQVLSVKVRGRTVPASCYSVTYENNADAGRGTVKLTGKKKAMGSAEETFEIRPGRPGSVSVKALGLQFSGLMSEPRRVKVTWSRPASGADRYEIRYGTRKDGTDAWTLTADGRSAEIRGLQAETVYYVWVRAVRNGVESDWTAVKKVTTR